MDLAASADQIRSTYRLLDVFSIMLLNEIVVPLPDLGVELRDPKRVDALLYVGNEVTVGLHRDRHPKLDSHGSAGIDDFFLWKRLHAPRPIEIALSVALGAGACAPLPRSTPRALRRQSPWQPESGDLTLRPGKVARDGAAVPHESGGAWACRRYQGGQ